MQINSLGAKITSLEVSCSIQLSYGRALENQAFPLVSMFHPVKTKAERYGNTRHIMAHYWHTKSHTTTTPGGPNND